MSAADMETWLHVGAVGLPIAASILGFFLRAAITQVSTRLERVEAKLDIAAESRVKIGTQVEGFSFRLDRLETRLDKVA